MCCTNYETITIIFTQHGFCSAFDAFYFIAKIFLSCWFIRSDSIRGECVCVFFSTRKFNVYSVGFMSSVKIEHQVNACKMFRNRDEKPCECATKSRNWTKNGTKCSYNGIMVTTNWYTFLCIKPKNYKLPLPNSFLHQ